MAAGKGVRHRAQRPIGIAILLVIIILGGMLVKNALKDDLLPQIIENLPQNVDLDLKRVHYSQNKNGVESWVLDADRAAYQRKEDELALTAVKMRLFNAGRFEELQLEAQSGVLYRKQKRLSLHGKVRIVAQTGEKFWTETLQYDYAKRVATTADPVRMLGLQVDLTGVGMVLDLEQGTLQVLNNVHALIAERSIHGDP
ncbi:MAG: LPS export ABC transporter periplasmic protein LptC [Geopsychrobacter sp.]|nr:LPS export ABC transporter periplasmic protein LptC [Geopsychrobacter sp.]